MSSKEVTVLQLLGFYEADCIDLGLQNGDSVCGSMVVAEAAVLKGLFCLEAQIALSLR